MSDSLLKLAWALIGAVFAAGVYYATTRQKQEKAAADINGLGKKNARFTALLVRWADTDQKRNEVADLIEPK